MFLAVLNIWFNFYELFPFYEYPKFMTELFNCQCFRWMTRKLILRHRVKSTRKVIPMILSSSSKRFYSHNAYFCSEMTREMCRDGDRTQHKRRVWNHLRIECYVDLLFGYRSTCDTDSGRTHNFWGSSVVNVCCDDNNSTICGDSKSS